ncbi:MAG: hypothetical protein HUK24_07260 [Sphaerochaetaceae bacterium]|nr:hypothetical protein [Sphaerochaetaceae bacterium]
MRRKILFINFLFLIPLFIIVLGLFPSCSENPGTTTLKLVLKAQSEGSKSLVPDNSSSMDVCKYTVSGTGPNGKTFNVNSDSPSITINGLTIGEWVITAKGLNSSNTELVAGTTTLRLTANAVPQTVVMDTLLGTGSFSFTTDWSLCDVESPNVEFYLSGPRPDSPEVQLTPTLDSAHKTATVSESLSSGSYRLRAILKDGSTQVAGLVESVRITNGEATTGSYTFHFNLLGPGLLMYFRDGTGKPITGNLSVQNNPTEQYANTEYTYLFTFDEPSTVDTDGLTIEWYVDGKLKSSGDLERSGSSITYEAPPGGHRIDAIVYNKLLGSTGSASLAFTAVHNGKTGELALLSEDGALNTTISVTDITKVGSLPNDRFLVLDSSSGKLFVCTIIAGSLKVEKTYTTDEFSFLSRAKLLISNPKCSVFVLTDDLNSTENITFFSFNASGNTITQIKRMEVGIPNFCNFKGFTAGAISPAGFIYMGDSVESNYDYIFAYTNTTVSFKGRKLKKGPEYNHVMDVATSYDGYDIAIVSEGAPCMVTGLVDMDPVSFTGTSSDTHTSPMFHVEYGNNNIVVAGNNTTLVTYKVVTEGKYTKYKTVDLYVKDLLADTVNYFYVVDNSNRIISFEVTGNEIAQLGSVSLNNGIICSALSDNYIISVTNNNKIAVFGIIE